MHVGTYRCFTYAVIYEPSSISGEPKHQKESTHSWRKNFMTWVSKVFNDATQLTLNFLPYLDLRHCSESLDKCRGVRGSYPAISASKMIPAEMSSADHFHSYSFFSPWTGSEGEWQEGWWGWEGEGRREDEWKREIAVVWWGIRRGRNLEDRTSVAHPCLEEIHCESDGIFVSI